MSKLEFSHHLSESVKYRTDNDFTTGESYQIPHPNPIYFNYGCPNHGFFPIKNISIQSINKPFNNEDTTDFVINGTNNNENSTTNKSITISQGFQYMEVTGDKLFYNFNKELILKVNPPAYNDWDLLLTCGSIDGLNKIFNILINPNDTILVEEYTFVPTVNQITQYRGIPIPLRLNLNPNKNSNNGIDLEFFEDLLNNWRSYHPNLRKPKALYTIPNGQNPTGITTSMETKKKIYNICQSHDILIIEDDPYGYIILNDDFIHKKIAINDYINNYISKSYLTIDTSSRVLRCETYSKTFAPGSRVGFIVANNFFIDHLKKLTELTTTYASGISQTIIQNLILQKGGFQGWVNWLIELSKAYSIRKYKILEFLKKTKLVQDNLINIIEPNNGMFISIVFKFENANSNEYNIKSDLDKLYNICLNNGIVVILGKTMAVGERARENAKFIRITLAMADNIEEIIEGARRLTKSFEEYFYS
ncbi:PLP-dependent transferase [Ascoidea rubescens DSM 1968]|uniref:PLP-dependent transferase n=1 Tax=Ascoidea rubescens DSM 1968 TaxID=1344418 RepID=A0A1D2VGF2_9ASCO|nr:PLP-dependent transferase [Ascoidea rubescens DSM 1968]ODV60741.1 PLP-dependent transferase [Ascoidea rubescens DSM 1968]